MSDEDNMRSHDDERANEQKRREEVNEQKRREEIAQWREQRLADEQADDALDEQRDDNVSEESLERSRETIIPWKVRRRGDSVDGARIGNTEDDDRDTFLSDKSMGIARPGDPDEDERIDALGSKNRLPRPDKSLVNPQDKKQDNDDPDKKTKERQRADDAAKEKDDHDRQLDHRPSRAKKDDDPLSGDDAKKKQSKIGNIPTLMGRKDDPVSAAQKRADDKKLRDLSAESLKPKKEKKRSDDDDDDDDDNKDGKKKKDKGQKGLGGSSNSSSKRSLSRSQKELLGVALGLTALTIGVAVFAPVSMFGSSDQMSDSIVPFIGVDEQTYNTMLLEEDAAAVAAQNQCFSGTSLSSDSALNSTGGGLFAPGESDPVAEVGGFKSNQIMHAQEIVAVGKEMSISEKGIFTALLVSREESNYINMANNGAGDNGPLSADQQAANIGSSMDHPFSEGLPSDNGYGHGGDHGSVGIFQQQVPWWGSVDELMNPRMAARKFYEALRDVDYDSMDAASAGQQVQRSYDPSGSNYRQHEPTVQALYDQIKSTPAGYNWNRYGGGGGDPRPKNVPTAFNSDKAEINFALHTTASGETVFKQIQNGSKALPTTEAILEEGQNFNSVRGARITAHRWDYVNLIGGYRPGDPQDHGKGDAIDIMIDDYRGKGEPIGTEIANFFVANADDLDVNYVIWQQKIFQPSAGDVWSPMEDRGSDTENHFDHVHVSFFPSPKYAGEEVFDIGASGGGSSSGSADDERRSNDFDGQSLSPNSANNANSNYCNTLDPVSPAGSNSPDEDVIKRDQAEKKEEQDAAKKKEEAAKKEEESDQ